MTIQQAIMSPGCGCDGQDVQKTLISIDEALDRIASHVTPLDRTEAVSLDSALGRILAQPVRSRGMVPPFDNAAMDGYAVASTDMSGNGPWALNVVARVPAGQEANVTLSGETTARIFTGAPIPGGADAVVMQEDVTRVGDVIHLHRRPVPGLNIRQAGSDMPEGATVLDKGHRLGAREIVACAAAGAGIVRVRSRLRVALLVTGDEVRKSGEARVAGQIWDVNTPMLAAALRAAGVEVVTIAHGADNRAGLARQLGKMSARVDLERVDLDRIRDSQGFLSVIPCF